MKRWMALATILCIPVFCGGPVRPSPQERPHAVWSSLFPKWDQYDEETRQEIRSIYLQSRNKGLWFPDSFPRKRTYATIYPKNYNDERLKKMLGE